MVFADITSTCLFLVNLFAAGTSFVICICKLSTKRWMIRRGTESLRMFGLAMMAGGGLQGVLVGLSNPYLIYSFSAMNLGIALYLLAQTKWVVRAMRTKGFELSKNN